MYQTWTLLKPKWFTSHPSSVYRHLYLVFQMERAVYVTLHYITNHSRMTWFHVRTKNKWKRWTRSNFCILYFLKEQFFFVTPEFEIIQRMENCLFGSFSRSLFQYDKDVYGLFHKYGGHFMTFLVSVLHSEPTSLWAPGDHATSGSRC